MKAGVVFLVCENGGERIRAAWLDQAVVFSLHHVNNKAWS